MDKVKEKMKIDASLKFQGSLPTSSDDLLVNLNNWNIKYKCYNHPPLRTVEESKKYQEQVLSSSSSSAHIKNLYLRDHKKNNFLFVTEQDQKIDLKKISTIMLAGRLSFGSPERLFEHLGVRPGAVSPFAMINGVKNNVKLFIDLNLKYYTKIFAHPLVNDRTLEITMADLQIFFEKTNVYINWIDSQKLG